MAKVAPAEVDQQPAADLKTDDLLPEIATESLIPENFVPETLGPGLTEPIQPEADSANQADAITLPVPPAPAASDETPTPAAPPPPETAPLQLETLDLAARDVRMVLREQSEQGQMLTTKLNILFVANGALLTSLSISRLLVTGSLFSLAEAVGFLLSFSLLMRAFLPRQVAVTPNLEDRKFLETYLALSYRDYQLQMLVNLAETYNANRQRLEDVSQGLKYAAYTTWATAAIMLVHTLMTYFQVSQ
ncbi:MAG TPA: hypothetical protein V6D06_12725 [Trichocoleus sp.]